jgi:hypothetical protein
LWFDVFSTRSENNELQNELHDFSMLSIGDKSFIDSVPDCDVIILTSSDQGVADQVVMEAREIM